MDARFSQSISIILPSAPQPRLWLILSSTDCIRLVTLSQNVNTFDYIEIIYDIAQRLFHL